MLLVTPVGKSTHTDPDAFKHSVASELMHDQWRLHISRLLMGVRHKATDKVRLAGVECGHQLDKRNKVDGGDGLAASLLLLLLLLLELLWAVQDGLPTGEPAKRTPMCFS